MKNYLGNGLILAFAAASLWACEKEESTATEPNLNSNISVEDREALLFMLEEEKLARDTYRYLDSIYQFQPLTNIAASEQVHMNAIASLLDQYGISYAIAQPGVFSDADLQHFYDQFISSGATSGTSALYVGATIEDLDIVDLQEYIDASTNNELIAVFTKLQCGSRNHLRAFSSNLSSLGETYEPQFLDSAQYAAILARSHEHCN